MAAPTQQEQPQQDPTNQWRANRGFSPQLSGSSPQLSGPACQWMPTLVLHPQFSGPMLVVSSHSSAFPALFFPTSPRSGRFPPSPAAPPTAGLHPCKACACPALRWRKGPKVSNRSLMDGGGSYMSEARSWSNIRCAPLRASGTWRLSAGSGRGLPVTEELGSGGLISYQGIPRGGWRPHCRFNENDHQLRPEASM